MKFPLRWLAAAPLAAALAYACVQVSSPASYGVAPIQALNQPSAAPPEKVNPAPAEAPPAAPAPPPFWFKLRAEAQRHILGPGNEIEDEQGRRSATLLATTDPTFPVSENGNTLGTPLPLENPVNLRRFYSALERHAESLNAPPSTETPGSATPGNKLRILFYGASHTQGDFLTGYLRHYLQARFGNGGLGFIQFAQLNDSYRSIDAKVTSNGFRIEHAQRKELPEHGWFGLLGAAAIATSAYAEGSIVPAARSGPQELGSALELWYMKEPRGGDFSLFVDDGPALKVTTRATPPSAGYQPVPLPATWQKLRLRPKGNGRIRVFGATLETTEAGIVIDTLGINGTRAANMLLWNELLWSEQLQRRDPRLVVLAYGTNEAVDTKQAIELYEANLRRVLERIKTTLPGADCLLVGPGDFPKEVPGGFEPRPRLLEIIDVQRRVAREESCGFWDTYAFMGGEGSMLRWAAATPPMGAKDHIHFSVRGYVLWGMAFADALLQPFDARLAAPPLDGAGASLAAPH